MNGLQRACGRPLGPALMLGQIVLVASSVASGALRRTAAAAAKTSPATTDAICLDSGLDVILG
jgi:hypothetical protein